MQWEEVIKLFPNGAENVCWSQGRLEKLTQEKPIWRLLKKFAELPWKVIKDEVKPSHV